MVSVATLIGQVPQGLREVVVGGPWQEGGGVHAATATGGSHGGGQRRGGLLPAATQAKRICKEGKRHVSITEKEMQTRI